MFQNTRISRRNFLKLNAMLSSAIAVSLAFPAPAVAKLIPTEMPTALVVPEALDLAHPTTVRFGTPTDVAATCRGDAWSVDVEGVIHKYDHELHQWIVDDDATDFPVGSQLVLARWGRPTGPNQMLMVLARTDLK